MALPISQVGLQEHRVECEPASVTLAPRVVCCRNSGVKGGGNQLQKHDQPGGDRRTKGQLGTDQLQQEEAGRGRQAEGQIGPLIVRKEMKCIVDIPRYYTK